MKNKKINVVGLLLIIVGALWLPSNLGYLNLDYKTIEPYLENMVEIWPIVMIVIGTFLITENRSKRWLSIIICLILLIVYTAFGADFLVDIKDAIVGGPEKISIGSSFLE